MINDQWSMVNGLLPQNLRQTDACPSDVAVFRCPEANRHLLRLAQGEVGTPPVHQDRASCECFRALYNKPNIRFVALCVLCKETSSDLVRARLKKYLLPNQEARLGRFIAEVFQINVRIAEASTYIAPVNQVAATRPLLRLPPFGQRRLIALPRILDVVSLQGLFPAIFGALRLYLSNIRQKTL